MNYKKSYAWICGVILFAAVGCKKEQRTPVIQPNTEIAAKKVATTPEELKLVRNLTKLGEVFKELYKDRNNVKVVNASIFAHIYSDESILLKDLVNPSKSRLNGNKKFAELTSQWNVSLNSFANQFWTIANRNKDPEFQQLMEDFKNAEKTQSSTVINSINGTQTHQYGDNEGPVDFISIYFPYSENYPPPPYGGGYQPVVSVVAATAEADEGWGYVPYYDAYGNFSHYEQVLVNDAWCDANATHIVGVNGIEVLDVALMGNPSPPAPPPGVNRVYIGEAMLKHQYDVLISFTGNGGGSEIMVGRLSGYLQPVNGQITSFQDVVALFFSRKAISRHRWERTFTMWDADWVPSNTEQVLAVYEEDNTSSVQFTGSLSTTLSIPGGPATVTGGIGYTITRQSQDAVIRELKISRHSYFTGAFQDQGWGFSPDATFLPPPFTHGWPIYDAPGGASGGVFGWTWPYNVY